MPQAPVQEALTEDAVATIRGRFAAEGIDIDADSARPLGDGTIDWDITIGSVVQHHIARADASTTNVSAET